MSESTYHVDEDEHYHPEINSTFVIYVKYNGSLYNEYRNYRVAVSVHPETTLQEIQEEALRVFNTIPELFLITFKGRRLLDNTLTVNDLGLRADDILDIQWD